MRKYTTDWKGITLAFAVGATLWIFFASLEAREGTLLMGSLIVVVPIGIGVLFATVFSYATINGHTLKFMYFLYRRRTIDILDITEINGQPTFKVAKGSFRSVYIFYETREKVTKYIEFRVSVYPEKTIGDLIRDLRKINPKRKLNAYCEKIAR